MKKNYTLLTTGLIALSINSIYAQCPVPSGVTASPTSLCAGASTSLNATATGASINWFNVPSAGTSLGTSGSGVNIAFTPTATTTYYAESYAIGTVTLNYTGGVQFYTVPLGVTSITVDVYGAAGYGLLGYGGRVQAVYPVTPGAILQINVGGTGTESTGGFNGGGNAGANTGYASGGGASDIRLTPYALANRVIVAGGGGGSGSNCGTWTAEGGHGGGLIGGSGCAFSCSDCQYTGAGGTQIAGGIAGPTGHGSCGGNQSGSLGQGGSNTTAGYGSGGGGGYYGGGSGCFEGAGGGSSYTSPSSTGVIHTQGVRTGNGQVIITAQGCTSISRTAVTVTVNAIPTITVTSGSICSGKSYTIVPSGANTYTIQGGSAVVSPLSNTNYTVVGTSTAGCVSSVFATSSVTVIALPTVSVTSGAICAGSSYTMMPSGASTYTYSSGSAVVSPTANASYNVVGTSSLGCVSSNTAVSTVTVNALPTVTTTASSSVICVGSTVTLTAVSSVGSYTWNTGATTSITPTPTMTTVYTATATSAAGCIGSAMITVTVNAIPTISVTSGAICSGTSFTVVASGATTYTYSGGSAVVTPTANASYTVTGNAAGCVGTSSAVSTVTVNTSPTISASASNAVICAGEATTLSATASSTTYTWNTGATTASLSVSPTTTTNYTVTTTATNGCTGTANVNVTVNACTGINEVTSSLISVYPNPNNGIVNITLTAALAQNSTLEIYDALGKLVVKQVLVNELNSVNMSNLDNGIYVFKVINNNNTVKIGKLIKQ